MLEEHLEGTAQEILEKLENYLTKSSFTNLDGDGLKYKIDKFSFDANTCISKLELVNSGNKKLTKRFIYQLIISDK